MFSIKGETMQRIVVVFIILLVSGVWLSPAEAAIARGGGGMRPQVGNRSAGASHGNLNAGSYNRGSVNRGNVNTGNINSGNINRGSIDRNSVNGNVNRNYADVNR